MTIASTHRRWFSYRGLSPHKFMPMPGVHKAKQHRPFGAGPRYARPLFAALRVTWKNASQTIQRLWKVTGQRFQYG